MSDTHHVNPVASRNAICRIRIARSTLQKDEPLLEKHNSPDDNDIPFETRLQWVNHISKQVLNRKGLDAGAGVRDWDLILRLDGSVENRADNALPSPPTRGYPERYRIPKVILEQIDSIEERAARKELFALGGLLYHVLSNRELFGDLGRGAWVYRATQTRFITGDFPDDVWGLPKAVRILACWCPGFARDFLNAHRANETFGSKLGGHIKKHPVIFGFQILGGIAILASLIAVPILGAVGFAAAGPVAGSAAAAWQSSIGLVEAGSIFAWCQSATMGGAAVGGILATGVAGAGVAVGATIAGSLDDVDIPASNLKEIFLAAWKRDIRGV